MCVRCGRPLVQPARSIPSKAGPLLFGRVCAIKSGLLHPQPRQRAIVDAMAQPEQPDPNQMALGFAI